MTNKIEIAVSPFGPLTPVIRGLAGAGFRFWSPTPDWAKALSDLDFPAKALGELVGQKNLADEAYTDAARILTRGVSDFSDGARGLDDSGLPPEGVAFLEDKAAAFLYPRLFDVCALVRALDETDVRLVVVHNDVEVTTRAMCLWARARGVPALHVPHAVYQDVHRSAAPGTDVHDLTTASHLASAGPFQTDWYVRRGFDPECVRETGRPALDPWARNEWGMTRVRARRQLRLPGEAGVVCYCSTWPQNTSAETKGENREWIWAYHAFLECVMRMPNVEGLVKCHPNGGPRNWQWHADEAKKKGVKITVTADHLPSCLWAADAVVGFAGSGVILEASFVPGLRLLSTHGYDGEQAVARTPIDSDGMREALEESLAGEQPDVGGFQARFCGEADGGASGRVAEWCVELARD